MNRRLQIFLLLFLHISLFGQADLDTTINTKIQIGGYIKYLHSAYVFQKNAIYTDQLLHHRLNLRQKLNKNHQWVAEIRDRVLYGQFVQLNQFTGPYLNTIDLNRNKLLHLSAGWESNKGIAALMEVDRAYWQWTPRDWEIRIGRQRVNWGISTLWNPNDLFNAYSFTDFDYEERPAVDGIRIKKYIGYSGSLESIVSVGKNLNDISYGFLYKTNIKTYDLQFLTGYSDQYFALGAGTAGNIGLAGVKAEVTTFVPKDRGNVLYAATMAIDYTWKNGIYLSEGVLYNSSGSISGDLSSLFNFKLSARNLYPFRWSLLTSIQKEINPLLRAGLVIVYSPVQAHALFINPTISYSIASAWDLDLVSQLAFNSSANGYISPLKGFYLRLKWSY